MHGCTDQLLRWTTKAQKDDNRKVMCRANFFTKSSTFRITKLMIFFQVIFGISSTMNEEKLCFARPCKSCDMHNALHLRRWSQYYYSIWWLDCNISWRSKHKQTADIAGSRLSRTKKKINLLSIISWQEQKLNNGHIVQQTKKDLEMTIKRLISPQIPT